VTPCDECLNRRGFLTRAGVVLAAAALASGCGDGDIGPPIVSNVPPGGSIKIKVGDFPGLATVGTVVRVGDLRAAVRTDATTILGLSMICTHQQCTTSISANQFICPCHGSRYASDGTVIDGPAVNPLAHLQTSYNPFTDILTIS
jgi:cytochrome b6-f complex iron-sulfur subunit